MLSKLSRVEFSKYPKLLKSFVSKDAVSNVIFKRSWYGVTVFGIHKLLEPDKSEFTIKKVTSKQIDMALDQIKKLYLKEHVLVRARNYNLYDDRALDEYIAQIVCQGNTLFATVGDGSIAGICVGYASSSADPRNLRNYAFYRQDPNTKEFLYFIAKLQETPNLWDAFKQKKIFEVKMLGVSPEYRRQGLATRLVEKCMEEAYHQGFNVIRMDCINPYDYRVAERCMLQCVVKFPLHKLRGPNAPFVKRTSPHNQLIRVYVGTRVTSDIPDVREVKERQQEIESLID